MNLLSVRSEVRQLAKRIPGLRPVVLRLRTLRHELVPRRWIFTEIYARNVWGDADSASGEGSNFRQTECIRRELPALLRRLGVRRVLDAPCGDFYWMREVANTLDEYTGVDIVGTLVNANSRRYGNPRVRFRRADVVEDKLPVADLILCRDCFVHLSFRDIWRALENMRISRASYLLTTTFTDREHNDDIYNGQWRPLNLERPPFNFPPPMEILNEDCSQRGREFADKSLALWLFTDLPRGPASRE